MATNSTYTLAQTQTQGTPARAQGRVTFDATAIVAADSVSMTCGFLPRYVCWENVTDRIKIEWYEGMAADSCIKTAANGTRTLEITSGNGGISINADSRGFSVLQNATLAAILASKVCNWVAIG
jgi:hypothetical protein